MIDDIVADLLFLCSEFRSRADALEFGGHRESANVYRECATSVDTYTKEVRRRFGKTSATIKRLNERAQRAEAKLHELTATD